MLILTTPNIEGKNIKEYYGLVSGEALLGANVYKDMFSGVRDVVEELPKALGWVLPKGPTYDK